MCGANMQDYHMAQIVLLIDKPQDITAHPTTIGARLSYRDNIEPLVYHCHEIWYVSPTCSTSYPSG